jgi:hypothetical protein
VAPSLRTFLHLTSSALPYDVTLTNTQPEWFNRLRAERKTIEAEVGVTDGRWEWDDRAGKPEAHIILKKSARLDGARRPQYEWLAESVHKFHEVFGPRVSSFK